MSIPSVVPAAGQSGAGTPFKYLAIGTAQDATNVKATPGTVWSVKLFNESATVRYVKLYNKVTAPASTDTPVHTYAIPGGSAGTGLIDSGPVGMSFSLGIGFRITTGQADNDTGSVTAGDVVVNLVYN